MSEFAAGFTLAVLFVSLIANGVLGMLLVPFLSLDRPTRADGTETENAPRTDRAPRTATLVQAPAALAAARADEDAAVRSALVGLGWRKKDVDHAIGVLGARKRDEGMTMEDRIKEALAVLMKGAA
jgi:RuvA, C-terminal domain